MGDLKTGFGTAASPTHTIASVATSSGLLAGRKSDEIDNSTTKFPHFFITLQSKVSASAVTANTKIQLFLIPKSSVSGSYPDGFSAGDANYTVTTYEQLIQYGRCIIDLDVPVTTAGRVYRKTIDTREFGFTCPEKFLLFFVQNTGQTTDTTGGNHLVEIQGHYGTY